MNYQKKKPKHIAIIMDGNGRWAEDRGFARNLGHEEGSKSVRATIRTCQDLGVEYLTLYAFSVQNWMRPADEIRSLMSLLLKFLKENESELHKHNIRFRVMGRIDDLSLPIQIKLKQVINETKSYDSGQLILALSYGGRSEITDAVKAISKKVLKGELDPNKIDELTIASHLYLPDIPDPDLLIRTSGEQRISNFLLWQISYTELYITDVLWPDFREEELLKAIDVYGERQRRFGDTEHHS